MRPIQINLYDGLSFGQRNSEFEQLFDVTLSAKQDVLVTRKGHKVRYNVQDAAHKMLYSPTHSSVFTLSASGTFRQNETVLATGYDTQFGSLVMVPPSNNHPVPYVFVAGGLKMSKYDGITATQWGIDAPPAAALTTALGSPSETLLNNCDASGEWVAAGAGFSVANDTGIKQQGTGSLAITVPAATAGTVTRTFAAPVNFGTNPEDIIFFWVRMTNPQSMRQFSLQFGMAADGFATHVATREIGFEFAPGIPPSVDEVLAGVSDPDRDGGGDSELFDSEETRAASVSSTPNTWKDVRIARKHFNITGGAWSAVHAMRFSIESTVAQTIYIDYVRIRAIAQDDVRGRRYKYRYFNTVTGHSSNANATPSAPMSGASGAVTVSGFAVSLDPQVNAMQVLGDVGGDGQFAIVGTKPNDANPFTDTTPIADLGDADTNDNAPPPRATICVYYAGSLWTNDFTNRNRIWRTVAGRLESFKDFFTVGETDDVRGMFVLGGRLYVCTVNKLLRVANPESESPQFLPVADAGVINERMYAVSTDIAVLVHFSGLYQFNGSTFAPMKRINTLFDLSSNDSRRINLTNLFTIRIGSDDGHVWLSYDQLDGTPVTYVLDTTRDFWTQESDVLVAHDIGHQTYHIAADHNGNVVDVYQGESFKRFTYVSDEIDLTHQVVQDGLRSRNATISRVSNLGVEYMSDIAVVATAYVDGVAQPSETWPAVAERTWRFLKFDSETLAVGQRLRLQFVAESAAHVQLYTAQWWVVEMQDDIRRFDSGEIFLSAELVIPEALNVHLFAHEPLTYNVVWYTDTTSQDVVPGQGVTIDAGPSFNQWFIRPTTGRTGRLVITASGRWSPIAFTVSVAGFGDGALKPVEIRSAAA